MSWAERYLARSRGHATSGGRPGGIAEEIGVSEGDVLVYIDRHPDWFLRDVVMDGVIYSNTVKLSPSLRAS